MKKITMRQKSGGKFGNKKNNAQQQLHEIWVLGKL